MDRPLMSVDTMSCFNSPMLVLLEKRISAPRLNLPVITVGLSSRKHCHRLITGTKWDCPCWKIPFVLVDNMLLGLPHQWYTVCTTQGATADVIGHVVRDDPSQITPFTHGPGMILLNINRNKNKGRWIIGGVGGGSPKSPFSVRWFKMWWGPA